MKKNFTGRWLFKNVSEGLSVYDKPERQFQETAKSGMICVGKAEANHGAFTNE